MPSRSWSYRGIDACIISILQQARPNDSGHIDPLRAQATSESKLVLFNYKVCQLVVFVGKRAGFGMIVGLQGIVD